MLAGIQVTQTVSFIWVHLKRKTHDETFIYQGTEYSRLSIIRAWFNRFAAQLRQCIFKEKFLFSVSITFV
jgi:hypothetical protein